VVSEASSDIVRSQEIQKLVNAVERAYGPVTLYGSDPSEEHGTCFKIAGIPATFSVHTQDGRLHPGNYDVQIEGVPAGDFLYASVLSLDTFLELAARMRGPEAQWPRMDKPTS
jgi:hypothetical protein